MKQGAGRFKLQKAACSLDEPDERFVTKFLMDA